MTKSQQLLSLMIHHYNREVSMEQILRITEMSSFNQRFQEWRKLGINVRHSTINGKSYYCLTTHPEAIDADRIELRQRSLFDGATTN